MKSPFSSILPLWYGYGIPKELNMQNRYMCYRPLRPYAPRYHRQTWHTYEPDYALSTGDPSIRMCGLHPSRALVQMRLNPRRAGGVFEPPPLRLFADSWKTAALRRFWHSCSYIFSAHFAKISDPVTHGQVTRSRQVTSPQKNFECSS